MNAGGGDGPGKWVSIGRRSSGSSLETQSLFSGKPIEYRNGTAYIEEYELLDAQGEPVYFDRYKDGVLGDVKDNYVFLIKEIGSKSAYKALREEAARQLAVAEKYGLRVEWHVRRAHVEAFERVLGRKYQAIKVVPWPPKR